MLVTVSVVPTTPQSVFVYFSFSFSRLGFLFFLFADML
jgi:hypothetical protein